jgi:hypothetical protein
LFHVTFPPRGCPNIFPAVDPVPVPPSTLLKAENLMYVAISDGQKKIYTNADKVPGYGHSDILNPNTVSYMNLFVNSMLQPPSLYYVQEGVLVLLSDDVPMAGVPIMLQFIRIYLP